MAWVRPRSCPTLDLLPADYPLARKLARAPPSGRRRLRRDSAACARRVNGAYRAGVGSAAGLVFGGRLDDDRRRRLARARDARGAAPRAPRCARGLHRVALARAAHRRLGPRAEVRLQLALGRPVDRRPALLARDLQRLLVLEEVAAVLAAALGRLDHARLRFFFCLACRAPRPPRAARPPRRRRGGRVAQPSAPPSASPASASVSTSGSFSSGRTPAASCAAFAQVQVPVQLSVLHGELPVLELDDVLRAVLAVLRIGIAGLAAHRARELAAALVDPGALAARAAAGALDVLQRPVDAVAALAHPVRRLGRRLARQAGVQLVAARPGPGLLAARGAAADLAVGDRAEVGLARSHIRRGGSLGSPCA